MDLQRFGSRIRAAREKRGLSQEEFAHLISKTQAAISDYENGRRRASISDLPLIAEVLQVSILYFFEGDLNKDDLDRNLLASFHQLSDAGKDDAIKIMNVLVEMDHRNTDSYL